MIMIMIIIIIIFVYFVLSAYIFHLPEIISFR